MFANDDLEQSITHVLNEKLQFLQIALSGLQSFLKATLSDDGLEIP